MIEVKRLTLDDHDALKLRNEPFEMPGRFIPSLCEGVWSYRIEPFEKVDTMAFPEENYNFEALAKNGVIFAACEEGVCLGLAIYQEAFFKYMYLYDLKVCAAARGRGIGAALIQAGMNAALKQGYVGLYTHAQDNNVNACLFYLKNGFEIGGFDNHVYNGTSQEGKADIIFYKNK